MGGKRYYCSHCDDFVSRSTRSRHLEQVVERKETEAESDSNSDVETGSPEVHCLETQDSSVDHETDLPSEDYSDSVSDEEVWDDLLEENVLDDLDESNFPGAVETDPDSFNRNILINWLLLFICYWWTYCNIADRGIEMLLKFFHAFFTVLSERVPWMTMFAAAFPSSLYMLKKYFGLHKDCFQKFVVCPKCHSLYNYDSAYDTVGGKRLSKKCSYVEFPNHRHRAHRKPCNEVLLKEVKLQDGKVKLYPKKPFKHSPYSVGVIYLALMNLPRGERYKRENIIVVGIIPGPSEPSSLNPYLVPLVLELKELWEDGIEVCHSGSPRIPERFFAAVLLVACDVPAARKLCGFLGHGARRGCSKCKKEFIPGENFGMKMNLGDLTVVCHVQMKSTQ
ncbi:hypothetical protein ACROYT_G016322 [Oculina patagonica]